MTKALSVTHGDLSQYTLYSYTLPTFASGFSKPKLVKVRAFF